MKLRLMQLVMLLQMDQMLGDMFHGASGAWTAVHASSLVSLGHTAVMLMVDSTLTPVWSVVCSDIDVTACCAETAVTFAVCARHMHHLRWAYHARRAMKITTTS
jgi:hypothetical protein